MTGKSGYAQGIVVTLDDEITFEPMPSDGGISIEKGIVLPVTKFFSFHRPDRELALVARHSRVPGDVEILTVAHLKDLGASLIGWAVTKVAISVDTDGSVQMQSMHPTDVVLNRGQQLASVTSYSATCDPASVYATPHHLDAIDVEPLVAGPSVEENPEEDDFDEEDEWEPFSIFISHAAADAGVATKIVAAIEKRAAICWIAPRNVRVGGDFRGEIVDAIRRCDAVVVLISPSVNSSTHVLRELGLAEKYGKPIRPVILNECELRPELEYQLQGLHWTKFSETYEFVRSIVGADEVIK